MNSRALARSLRQGGWTEHARGLSAWLCGPAGFVGGRTCTRRHADIDLVFGIDERGEYVAHLGETGDLVADEQQCHLEYSRVRAEPMTPCSYRLPDALRNRVSRYASSRSLTASDIVRRALSSYLTSRGA